MHRPLFDRFSPIASEADLLLADVLFSVQLPPSDYAKAEGHYHSLADWLERDGSPLRGLVERVYGQGGVAQGSSIASRATNDEFDVDAMVELHPSVDRGPAYVLDLLYKAVRGEPGSRYYRVTTRCTRCVQVQYDKMHVDLTPAILHPGMPERQSTIFHHRVETPHIPGRRHIANPYAFTDWFKLNTPAEPIFALSIRREGQVLAKADVESLPDQVGPHGMSRALASLQLTKRFRNLRYDRRSGRCPPSILLAKLVAGYRAVSLTFAAAVLEHAIALRDRFQMHVTGQTLIEEHNPRCREDVLTDRWPSSQHDQSIWLGDLKHLVRQLTRYCGEELSLRERQEILGDLFGERAAGTAVRNFAERVGREKELGVSRYQAGTGRLVMPALVLPSAAHARVIPDTSYFGGQLWRR